jgi:ABC-2 type transport system ATP-binding protein
LSEPAPVLDIADLHKSFRTGFRRRRVDAVRGISLSVKAGEIFGFLGPNGAGKSTTIKVCVGLMRPTRGEVRLFGKSVASSAVRARLGFLPEQPYFYDYLTARETLRFYGSLCGMDRSTMDRRIDEVLALVGLSDTGKKRLRQFSKGMVQRVGIAQAIQHDPDLVILDEPLSGLDPIGRREIRDVMVSLAAAGKTVFFSSHILSDIETICDRVAIIHQGRIRCAGTLDDLLDRGRLVAEVVCTGGGPGLRETVTPLALTVEPVGATLRAVADRARVDAIIDAARRCGAEIHSVTSRRESLEDLFMREAVGSTPARPQPPEGRP